MIDNRTLLEKLRKIAVPIALQGVISATLTLVDNLMVGALGEAELAAVGIAMQVFIIHYVILFGINSGISTFIAQFYGKGDPRNIRKCVGLAVTIAGVISLVFFAVTLLFPQFILRIYTPDKALAALALPYLRIGAVTFLMLAVSAPLEITFRATQQPRIPLKVSIAMFTTNTVLNYLLIFGKFGAPAMGIAGAATATVIARGLGMCLMLYSVMRSGSNLRGPLKDFFGWSPEFVRRVAKNAIPTTLNELFWVTGTSLYVAAFARMGTTSYASYQAAEAIRQIFSFASFSVGDAALILIGEKLGEGNREYAMELAKKLLVIAIFVGLAFGIGVIAVAWPLTRLFALSALGRSYAVGILMVTGGTMWITQFAGVCTVGVLRGGGDTAYAARTEILCIWGIAVPIAFASALWWHIPIYLAVLCMRSAELTESVIMFFRIRSGKWANTVVRGL